MTYLIALLCGVLTALPFIFPDLWILAWIAVAPLFWLAAQKKSAYRHGLAFFAGFYGLTYHWFIYLYPMDFAGFDNLQSVALIALCWAGMTALQGSVFALVPVLYRRLRTGRAYLDPFLAASLWVSFEWLQTQTWLGVPWSRLAVSQYQTLPVIQSASLLGSLFVSFLIILANGFIASAAQFSARPHAHGVAAPSESRAYAVEANTVSGDNRVRAVEGTVAPSENRAYAVEENAAPGENRVCVVEENAARTGTERVKPKSRRAAAICAAVAAAVFTANLAYGAAALSLRGDGDGDGGAVELTAAVIQGNIASGDKWADDSVSHSLLVYIRLTTQACLEYSPKIVLWPETVITVSVRENATARAQISELAKATGAVILVGAYDYVRDGETGDVGRYNAIVAFYPDGSVGDAPYYKRHIVPFGEYLPSPWFFKTFLPMLAEMNVFKYDLTPGIKTNLIETDYGKLGGLVCFDSIYEELARSSVNGGAELITLSTNDSWYRDSAAVRQHNGHAALRAVENGRYVIRAANTGISSVISPTGEILTSLAPLTEGYTAANVKMLQNRTVYSYVGDVWIIACAAFLAGLGVWKAVGRFKKRKAS